MTISSKNLSLIINQWFDKSIFDLGFELQSEEVIKHYLDIFLHDYNRYYPGSEQIDLEKVIKRPELPGILLYRIARSFYLAGNECAANSCANLGRFLSGFEIYYTSVIGKGLKINHGLGTVIGARTIIGENALIHQGVTFGDKNGSRPTIGNNVIIYSGAQILGGICIGDDVIIGASTLCIKSVPKGKIVAGIPGKIIN
jgi:serine O-acetyltransferase